MPKIKAGRNKTIDTTIEEGAAFLERCITISENQASLNDIINKTIFMIKKAKTKLNKEKSLLNFSI